MPSKARRLSISCVLPFPVETVWEKLQSVDTLQYIARPFAYFRPLSPSPAWQEGEVFRFRLSILGVIPIKEHAILVEKFSREELCISTRESNDFMTQWDHEIILIPQGEDAVRYTDTVTMRARFFTGLVFAWAVMFYRHRQRKWRHILKPLQ